MKFADVTLSFYAVYGEMAGKCFDHRVYNEEIHADFRVPHSAPKNLVGLENGL